jgi:hypothetical protein
MRSNFSLESLKGRAHSEHLIVHGSIILKRRIRMDGVNWFHVARDREWVLVYTVMSLRFP